MAADEWAPPSEPPPTQRIVVETIGWRVWLFFVLVFVGGVYLLQLSSTKNLQLMLRNQEQSIAQASRLAETLAQWSATSASLEASVRELQATEARLGQHDEDLQKNLKTTREFLNEFRKAVRPH